LRVFRWASFRTTKATTTV
jgi:hypothetical protein